jgi:hypothetical protein
MSQESDQVRTLEEAVRALLAVLPDSEQASPAHWDCRSYCWNELPAEAQEQVTSARAQAVRALNL